MTKCWPRALNLFYACVWAFDQNNLINLKANFNDSFIKMRLLQFHVLHFANLSSHYCVSDLLTWLANC